LDSFARLLPADYVVCWWQIASYLRFAGARQRGKSRRVFVSAVKLTGINRGRGNFFAGLVAASGLGF
jgi:hypothetical protein